MDLRVFLNLSGVVLLAFAGCDTPAARARIHQGTFGKLSPDDRQLVLAGKVRPGMERAAVYIAWGEPDIKTTAVRSKDDEAEIWLYRRQLTLRPAMDSFDRWSPGNGVFGRVVPLTINGGFGFGGVGNEGMTLYQPHLSISDDTVKRAEFAGGLLKTSEVFQAGSAAVTVR